MIGNSSLSDGRKWRQTAFEKKTEEQNKKIEMERLEEEGEEYFLHVHTAALATL